MRLTAATFTRVAEWSKKFANLPDRYIQRRMEKIYWKPPKGKPQFLPRVIKDENLIMSIHRPWTNEFQLSKKSGTIYVEPIKHWSFFRGDRVEVLVGRDKGKQGIVKYIVQERNWVIVEGLNTTLKCIEKSKDFPGIYMQEEQPLLVTTDVQLVDPSDLKGTQIEWRYNEQGEHVRVSCRTGRVIPIPVSSQETIDYKQPHLYKEQPKDTSKEDVEKVTFQPVLKTFEMDIMDKMGIKEDRTPQKYYWY